MKKIISMIILMFIFILISNLNLVNANIDWLQNANSNYQSYGGNSFIMYGSNTKNPEEDLTYSKCPFLYFSDYQPVVADFTRDGFKEIALTDVDTNTIYFYNTMCELIDTYSVGEDIMAMPIITYPIVYNLPILNILTNESYKKYGYFSFDIGFDIIGSEVVYSDYIWWEDGEVLNFFVCNNDDCLLFITNEDEIYHIDVNANYFINTSNKLNNMLFSEMSYTGVSSILGAVDDDWIIACSDDHYEDVTDRKIYCNLIDVTDGSVEKVFTTVGSPASGWIKQDLFEMNYGGAVQDGERRIYLTYNFDTRKPANNDYDTIGISVFSLSGELLYEDDIIMAVTSPFDYSNIAVADFDKDGNNEMCYFKCNSDYNNKTFSCYDGDFNLIFQKDNMSEDFSYTGSNQNLCPDFVLGDFMTEYDNLCLATVEGIFCFNETNHTIHTYNTGYTSGSGNPLVVEINDDGYLGVIYSDSDKGFVITPDFINYTTCGNGICELWENSFTCSQDCYYAPPDIDPKGEYKEDSPCETDADCADGLKCEYGICSKLGYNQDCTSDDDCVSGSCINGKCTKPSLWQGIDASKDQMMGDDISTNNLLSILIMLLVSGSIGYYFVIWGGIASLFILAIFFTMVGWLSGFILVGLLIVGVIALVFSLIIGGKPQ